MDDHKEKSRKMSLAKGSTKILSTIGQKGKDSRGADLVSSNILMSTKWPEYCIPKSFNPYVSYDSLEARL